VITEATKTKRLFVALPVTTTACDIFALYQNSYTILRGIHWTPVENLHITVQFLGDVEVRRIEIMTNTLKNIAKRHKAFELTFDRVIFGSPGKRDKRMIWAVFRVCPQYNDLVREVSALLRPFCTYTSPHQERIPHITLARFHAAEAVAGVHLDQPTFKKSMPVREMKLMGSALGPNGSVYSEVATAMFDQ